MSKLTVFACQKYPLKGCSLYYHFVVRACLHMLIALSAFWILFVIPIVKLPVLLELIPQVFVGVNYLEPR